jgi:hypothetical protein
MTRPDGVNALEQRVDKINVSPSAAGGGSPHGTNLQTMLNKTWIRRHVEQLIAELARRPRAGTGVRDATRTAV